MNAATGAVEQVEEAMNILSIAELLCLTRFELLELRRYLEVQVTELPYDSTEFREAVLTLSNVRQALIQIDRFNAHPSPS